MMDYIPAPLQDFKSPLLQDRESIITPVPWHNHDGVNSPRIQSFDLPESGPKSATFIIGPESNSDSSTYDYVTDGTDDDVQIQAAIDALPDNGGRILFREGTYTCGAKVIVSNNGVTLQGQGKGSIITAKNSLNTDIIQTGKNGTSYFNCVIDSFYFDGNSSNQGANSYIINNNSNGTNVMTGLEIKNCYFEDSAEGAINNTNTSATPMVVKDNWFQNWKAGQPAIAVGTAKDKILGNHFTTTGTGSAYINGGGASKALVIGNSFDMPNSYNTSAITDVYIFSNNTVTVGSSAGASAVIADGINVVTANTIIFGASANGSSKVALDCSIVTNNYATGAGTPFSNCTDVSHNITA